MASHVFHQLYYHIVWSTKDRQHLIGNDNKEFIIEQVQTACSKRDVEALACNTMPDHLHLFVRLPPAIAVATFTGEIKGATSFAHNQRYGERCFLKWQDGYGVVSVRKAEARRIIDYVENQEKIHRERKASRILETTVGIE
jgi:REP element-mobilizing transposase RayT